MTSRINAYGALILCCILVSSCCGHRETINETRSVNWFRDYCKPEYVLMTDVGRKNYLADMGDAIIAEKFGNDEFMFINGIPFLTVQQSFFSKYGIKTGDNVNMVYFYKSLTERGMKLMIQKSCSDMNVAQIPEYYIIRELNGVARIIYNNKFLFQCSFHPYYHNNEPGSCPLCSLPLALVSGPVK